MIITVVGNTFPAFRFLYLKELGVRETVGQTEYYYKEAVVLFLILFFHSLIWVRVTKKLIRSKCWTWLQLFPCSDCQSFNLFLPGVCSTVWHLWYKQATGAVGGWRVIGGTADTALGTSPFLCVFGGLKTVAFSYILLPPSKWICFYPQ